MKSSSKCHWVIWLVVILVLPNGCSDENGAPASGTGSDLVSVTGTVTRIVDDTPVDGDVNVDLDVDGGGTEILYLPARWNPTTEEQEEVYWLIRQLAIGHRVTARGVRVENRIELRSLMIFSR